MYSSVTYTGNGSQKQFAVPFPYLDQSHVAVTVNGVATSFSWVQPQTISISPAPANGATVLIVRNSSRAARLSNYQDAQVLTEAAMDFDALQLFYVAQEAFDAVASAAVGGDMRRSMNLSDVYDLNAARQNLNAVNRAGDQMAGRLYLFASPQSPSEAATKAYVDAILGTSGAAVSSFNGRTGAISLTGTDVTNALTFTPVNKAGDTMTGALVLAADPTTSMQAATKQYVDTHAVIGSTGEWTFPSAATTTAAATLTKTQAPANFNDGVESISFTRNAGVAVNGKYYLFGVTAAVGAGTSDVADAIIAHSTNIQGGGLVGHAVTVATPKTATGNWSVGAALFQPFERQADQGILRDLSGGRNTFGVMVAPQTDVDVGDGTANGKNVSAGFVLSRSADRGFGPAKTWVGMLMGTDSIVPAGVNAVLRGGSTALLEPSAALELWDNFALGIDFRNATLNGAAKAAIAMNAGQVLSLSADSAIYTDATTHSLTFVDSISGAKTLAQLISGAAGFDLTADHTFTGKNYFNKVSALNAPGFRVQSLGNGAMVNADITVDTGYIAGTDIRKTSNLATDATAGNVALYVQHRASGQTPVSTAVCGIRNALSTTQSHANGTFCDAVAIYNAIYNNGTDVGGFGYHVDATHAPQTNAGVTWAYSAEMYRQNDFGTTAAFLARSQGAAQGGGHKNDFAFVAGFGGDSTGWGSMFAGGFSFGNAYADRGLDFRYTTIAQSAITIPANSRIFFDAGESISQRFNSATGYIEFQNGGGNRAGIQMSNGVLAQWDGINGSFGSYYVDAAGTQPAIMSVRSGARTSPPANPSAVANWLTIKIDGTTYRLPVYL